jgi:hypothetical protein
MKRKLAPLALLLALLGLGGITQTARAQEMITTGTFAVSVDLAREPPLERPEVSPAWRDGFVWAPGYWGWDGYEYVWVEGHWLQDHPGYALFPGRWVVYGNGLWRFLPEHWEVRQPVIIDRNLQRQRYEQEQQERWERERREQMERQQQVDRFEQMRREKERAEQARREAQETQNAVPRRDGERREDFHDGRRHDGRDGYER